MSLKLYLKSRVGPNLPLEFMFTIIIYFLYYTYILYYTYVFLPYLYIYYTILIYFSILIYLPYLHIYHASVAYKVFLAADFRYFYSAKCRKATSDEFF